MQSSANEDNDDVIESFWLYIFSVFPSFVYYYPSFLTLKQSNHSLSASNFLFLTSFEFFPMF